MRKRKHWLKIDGKWPPKIVVKAWNNLRDYLIAYPDSKISVFNAEYTLFDKYFCLECSQDYNDLDLDCNSMFDGTLIHLRNKPKSIKPAQDFSV